MIILLRTHPISNGIGICTLWFSEMSFPEFSTSCDGRLDVGTRRFRNRGWAASHAKKYGHYEEDDNIKCEAARFVLFQLNCFGWKDRTSNKGIRWIQKIALSFKWHQNQNSVGCIMFWYSDSYEVFMKFCKWFAKFHEKIHSCLNPTQFSSLMLYRPL